MAELHRPCDLQYLISPQRRAAGRVLLIEGYSGLASQIANQYAYSVDFPNSPVGKIKRRMYRSRSEQALYRLFSSQNGDPLLFETLPNGPNLKESLDTVCDTIYDLSTIRAFNMSIDEAEKIVKQAVNVTSFFKYSMTQIASVYASVGMSPREREKLVRMLKISIPAMIIVNGAVGTCSEMLVGYLGLNQYRNEILQYLNTVDPAVRNLFAVLGPVLSQGLLFLLTDMRNKLSIEMGENGLIPFDPAQYAVYKLTNAEKKQNNWKQIVSRCITHIAYPFNWLDYKWFGTLLAGDYGVTFTGGVLAAILVKILYLMGGNGAIKMKQYFDNQSGKVENGQELPDEEEIAAQIRNDLRPDIIRWLSTKTEEELSELFDVTKIPSLHTANAGL